VLAAVISPSSSPVLAVGSAFIDLTPPALKDFAVETFGTNDKLVLLVGMAVVIFLLAAVAGILAARRRAFGWIAVGLLGLVAAVAAYTRAAAGPLDVLPSLVGAGAGILVLDWLLDRLARVPDQAGGADRRSFLVAAGVTAAVAAVAGVGARVLGQRAREVVEAREAISLPTPQVPADPLPSGVELEVDGITPWATSNEEFYRIDTALSVPRVNPDAWTLRVFGMVEEEVEISYAELLQADLTEAWVTLTCVSNEVGGDLAGNAKWLGMPIRDLLERARPLEGADMVLSRSVDGFTASTPLEVLQEKDRDSLLAFAMNDEPLPLEHGFPVRMVVPGLYGFVSATKWVVEMEITRFADATAYWTDRGWSAKAPVKTASRIDVPASFAKVPAGRVPVGGVAWAQFRGITAVEVQADDGEWQQATLADEATVDSWRQWSFMWDAEPGTHTLRVRATDATGEVQTEERARPVPDGASGWHSVNVTVT
jgi:DMSO/TMAO reductase YedYZ molybdopterin-dependent catalytic subunit